MPAPTTLLAAPSPTAAHLTHRFRVSGWLFTAAWLGALALRRLVREGMFGDGLTYAAIARNLAEGRGSVWAPFFSHSFWLPYDPGGVFYGHPPLQFWLQAGLFRLFGDSLYVEKAWCGLLIVLTALLLAWCWRRLVPADHPAHGLDWLPALVWFTFRTAEWASTQNLLDCTMSTFCMLAVWLLLEADGRPLARQLALDALAGLALVGGLLTKGPVALHVLGVPFLVETLFHRRFPLGRMFRRTATLLAVVVTVGALLAQHEPARQFFAQYFRQQLVASLSGAREHAATLHAAGRFYIVQLLVLNPLPAIAFGLVLRWAVKRWRASTPAPPELLRIVALGTGLALAASLPITLSVKQYSHYLAPALPYAALAVAAWLAPPLLRALAGTEALTSHPRRVRLLGAATCLAVVLRAIRVAGEPFWNDRELITDVHALARQVPKHSNVGVCGDLMRNFAVHSYLQRYHRQELVALNALPRFAIVDFTCNDQPEAFLDSHGYVPVVTPMTRFRLFEKPKALSARH